MDVRCKWRKRVFLPALIAAVIIQTVTYSYSNLNWKGQPDNTTTAGSNDWQMGFSTSADYPPVFVSKWPAIGAVHRTSKFAGALMSNGIISGFKDHLTGESTPSFEFPANSGMEYLWQANLWIGGIVGDDTLVSTGTSWDINMGMEFHPPSNPLTGRGTSPTYLGLGMTYRAHYVDTFTANDHLGYRPHIPLNLSVVQKSYSIDTNPYRNIMLMDFIITNIGAELIEKAYLGILVDGDVCSPADESYQCYIDDLTGSLRDISTGYIIDNDGDPQGGFFQDSLSPIDGLALRPIIIYPPVTDTNYNWWLPIWTIDFGPRQRGTADDPFRDFQTDGIGWPSGDINKYYVLRHREWDYDQVMTATIDSTDGLWLYPDQSLAGDISDGFDARFLLSVGPADLLPDSSIRAVFALFGGDFVHVDPTNGKNLSAHDYRGYYYNLHFDILRQPHTP